MKKIWYLPGPFFRYDADVKAIARAAGFRIVDAHVTTDRRDAISQDEMPHVGFKPEYKPTADDVRAASLGYVDPEELEHGLKQQAEHEAARAAADTDAANAQAKAQAEALALAEQLSKPAPAAAPAAKK